METKVCKCCGRELPIDDFSVTKLGRRNTCNECVGKKAAEVKKRKKDGLTFEEELERAKRLRLQDFTPRELMAELKRCGYDGKLTFTQVIEIDIAKI